MTIRGTLSVASAEAVKLSSQVKARALLAACLVAPFLLAAVLTVQSTTPDDTLYGRSSKDSGYAMALVVLAFGAFWPFSILTSVVAGDLFASEDRHRTWAMLLTRSRSRAEVFWGKAIVGFAASTVAIVSLGISSLAAGVLVIGNQPLIDLSGTQRAPAEAAGLVALAWLTALPPALAFSAVAMLLSIVTRNSAAGIGIPVVLGLLMQLSSFVDGPELVRRLLLTTAYGDWHGLLAVPPFTAPLWRGITISAGYMLVSLVVAYRLMTRRDIDS